MIGQVTQTLEYKSEIYNSQQDGNMTDYLQNFAKDGWQIIHIHDLQCFEFDSVTRFIFQRVTENISGIVGNERSHLAIN